MALFRRGLRLVNRMQVRTFKNFQLCPGPKCEEKEEHEMTQTEYYRHLKSCMEEVKSDSPQRRLLSERLNLTHFPQNPRNELKRRAVKFLVQSYVFDNFAKQRKPRKRVAQNDGRIITLIKP